MMKKTRKNLVVSFLLLGLAVILVAPATAEETPGLLPIEPVPMIQVSDWVPAPRPSPAPSTPPTRRNCATR